MEDGGEGGREREGSPSSRHPASHSPLPPHFIMLSLADQAVSPTDQDIRTTTNTGNNPGAWMLVRVVFSPARPQLPDVPEVGPLPRLRGRNRQVPR